MADSFAVVGLARCRWLLDVVRRTFGDDAARGDATARGDDGNDGDRTLNVLNVLVCLRLFRVDRSTISRTAGDNDTAPGRLACSLARRKLELLPPAGRRLGCRLGGSTRAPYSPASGTDTNGVCLENMEPSGVSACTVTRAGARKPSTTPAAPCEGPPLRRPEDDGAGSLGVGLPGDVRLPCRDAPADRTRLRPPNDTAATPHPLRIPLPFPLPLLEEAPLAPVPALAPAPAPAEVVVEAAATVAAAAEVPERRGNVAPDTMVPPVTAWE